MTTMGLPLDQDIATERWWGMHLVVDLYDCDPQRISDGDLIRKFVAELVELVGMNAFGELFLVRFALHDPEAAGYTAMQAIETSSITAHFAEGDRTAYIDMFSCKLFDARTAAEFIATTFGAGDYDMRVLGRGRRRR